MTLYTAQRLLDPGPLHITSTGRYAIAGLLQSLVTGTPALNSATWPTNNLAVYAPIAVPHRFTVGRFLWVNGANLTGSADVGLYSATGSRLMSTGATARAGATAVQYVGVTDQSFPPGHYYLALVGASTTGSYLAAQLANQYEVRMSGWLQEVLGSTTLPTTMTPVSFTGANAFGFGFTQSDTL